MKARKRFGQNFLQDAGLIGKIVDAISPTENENVVEIGPGRGAITRLLYTACPTLKVIEIDRDLAHQLRFLYPDLNVIELDVLKQDFRELGTQMRVVGNLPYNISTPILFKLFEQLDLIRDMFFMLQLEVVQRLAAEPGSSNYGRLSVMSQYYCDSELLFQVPPEAFTPRPKVTSAIVKLVPKTTQIVAQDEVLFSQMVNQAFSMRRKTLRNALKGFVQSPESFESLEIDPKRRPETVTLTEFVQLADAAARERIS